MRGLLESIPTHLLAQLQSDVPWCDRLLGRLRDARAKELVAEVGLRHRRGSCSPAPPVPPSRIERGCCSPVAGARVRRRAGDVDTAAMEQRTKVVYKITYPNGKIYVGMDLTGTLPYFGSAHGPSVAADFTPEQRRDFTARKEVLWESDTATDAEVRQREKEFIGALRSNDPQVGYNRWPRLPPGV